MWTSPMGKASRLLLALCGTVVACVEDHGPQTEESNLRVFDTINWSTMKSHKNAMQVTSDMESELEALICQSQSTPIG